MGSELRIPTQRCSTVLPLTAHVRVPVCPRDCRVTSRTRARGVAAVAVRLLGRRLRRGTGTHGDDFTPLHRRQLLLNWGGAQGGRYVLTLVGQGCAIGASPSPEIPLVLCAVDDDTRPRYPTRSLRHEEGDDICHLFRLAHPRPRNRREHGVVEARVAFFTWSQNPSAKKMGPGATEFARIFCGASATASEFA